MVVGAVRVGRAGEGLQVFWLSAWKHAGMGWRGDWGSDLVDCDVGWVPVEIPGR